MTKCSHDSEGTHDFKIGPRQARPERLIGPGATVGALRRLRDLFDQDPFPGDPEIELPPPPPRVSPPDSAFQVRDLRSDVPCGSGGSLDDLIDEIRVQTQSQFASADVRVRCDKDGSEARILTIGIWILPALSEELSQARDEALARLDLLFEEDSFGLMTNSSLIRRQVATAFAAQPKRLNHGGQPDPDGSIHLESIQLRFESPDKVVTAVKGYDTAPWPDVNFTSTTTDTLAANGGTQLLCETDHTLDTDTNWHFALGALTLPLFGFGLVFLIQGIIAENQDAQDTGAGPGCNVAAGYPSEVLLRRENPNAPALKLVFDYRRVNVTAGGIFSGGTYLPIEREPEVDLRGLRRVSADVRQSTVRVRYRAVASDLRQPVFAWSVDGRRVSGSGPSQALDLDVANVPQGGVVRRRVRVEAVDADELRAADELQVELHVEDRLDDDIPPVCRAKPWLPQCDLR